MAALPAKLREVDCLSRSLADHPLDQVHAAAFLGDAVLDLQARVDLEEVELVACLVVEKLHRACAGVAGGCGKAARSVHHGLACYLR